MDSSFVFTFKTLDGDIVCDSNLLFMISPILRSFCERAAGRKLDFVDIHQNDVKRVVSSYIYMFCRPPQFQYDTDIDHFDRFLKGTILSHQFDSSNVSYERILAMIKSKQLFDVLVEFPRRKYNQVCYGLSRCMNDYTRTPVEINIPLPKRDVLAFLEFLRHCVFQQINTCFIQSMEQNKITSFQCGMYCCLYETDDPESYVADRFDPYEGRKWYYQSSCDDVVAMLDAKSTDELFGFLYVARFLGCFKLDCCVSSFISNRMRFLSHEESSRIFESKPDPCVGTLSLPDDVPRKKTWASVVRSSSSGRLV